MRISDWSSDVCSSDLDLVPAYPHFLQLRGIADGAHLLFDVVARDRLAVQRALALAIGGLEAGGDCVEFGRSTRRRRRWQDDALLQYAKLAAGVEGKAGRLVEPGGFLRSEEHTSELPSLMRISYALFCLKKKKQ